LLLERGVSSVALAIFVITTILTSTATPVLGTFEITDPAHSLFNPSNQTSLTQIQYQNEIVHAGDIFINDTRTLEIHDCQFNQTGQIILRDNARLVISDSTLVLNWNTSLTSKPTFWLNNMILQNQSSLIVTNSTLLLGSSAYDRAYHYIALSDEATANITNSDLGYSDGLGDFLLCQNSSKAWLENVVFSTFYPVTGVLADYPHNGLGMDNQAQAEVQNSTLDYVYIGAVHSNCTLTFESSSLQELETFGGDDISNIELTNCNASLLNIQGHDTDIRLTNTTTAILNKNTTARIVLLDSSIQNIYVYDHSNMWVVWTLPLFGQVLIPYNWVPYVIPVTITSITIPIVVLIISVLYLKVKRKQNLKLESETKEADKNVEHVT